MEFIKRNEIIEKIDNDWSYFSIKFLNINSEKEIAGFSDRNIIESLIRSKYHFWNGEVKPNGLTITNIKKVNNENFESKVDGIKFCGQFDNAKIKTENYKRVNFTEFKNTMYKKVEDYYSARFTIELEKQIEHIINQNCNQSETFYLLALNPEKDFDKICEHNVFSFFVRFIAISEKSESIKVIEIGSD